jgi:hypothetical protein
MNPNPSADITDTSDTSDTNNEMLEVFPLTKSIPSKIFHINRNKYNNTPTSPLLRDNTRTFKEILNESTRTFKEEQTGRIWNLLPWYYNLLHNPIKNVKLICFDFHTFKNGVGSSEIIVAKKSIENTMDDKLKIPLSAMKEGSYNYRDLYICGNWKHLWADIFPNIMYCKC